MFLLRRPTDDQVSSFLASIEFSSFSYNPTRLTQLAENPGYNTDHNRRLLGHGPIVFEQAMTAIRSWKMFDIHWLTLYWPDTAIEVGATMAVLVQHLGIWSLNACRVVYLIKETGSLERFGFAYGTLQDHAERGEERFTVEWNKEDDSVWYDIFAVSKPGTVARMAYPYARRLQSRFAKDSLDAMFRAVNEGTGTQS